MSNPRQSGLLKGVLIGCGGIVILGCLLLFGTVAWLLTGPEGGVRLSNEMEDYAIEYLEEHPILNESEELVAYYDVTISLDGSEAAILTTERVIYYKSGRSTSVLLTDIEDIRHRNETLIGDVIEIDSRSGPPMKIEIAPLNQGETFLNALRNAYERK